MKKAVMKAVVAMAAVALASPAARAAEATVGLDVASAYVFRGITLSDEVSIQPSLEVAGLPVTLGVWADFDAEAEGMIETDFYASYGLPVEGVDASVGYTEYAYGAGAAEREVSLSAGIEAPLAPTVGLYYMVDSDFTTKEQFYADLSVGHDLELAEGIGLNLGAAVSYVVQGEGSTADDGFNHYEASATLSYKIASLGVKYIGQIDDEVLTDADPVAGAAGYDEDVVVTAGISHSF